MGDRANIKIVVEKDKPALFLYSHWNGAKLPKLLQDALRFAKGRWTDPSYCIRILIDQVAKDGRGQETGWGLSFSPDDNEHNLLVVDIEARTVNACQFSNAVEGHEGSPIRDATTFAEYLELTDPCAWRDED